ncbi:MAG: ABC transporter ATP-binding protein [Methylococcales bacterium]|nr:ABC transporter ATP-binding protein [Methylococcales bacterium]
MRTLLTYIQAFPKRSALMLLALLCAGVAEGLSLTTFIPLLSIATGQKEASGVGGVVVELLTSMNITPSIGVMLLIIVGGMILKSLILLVANRQTGFTVAHVATALRLELIEALLASNWQYYLKQPIGALANAMSTEAYRAANGFEHSANVAALLVQVLVYSLVALFISWQATLACLTIGLLLLAVLHSLVRATRKAGQRQTHLLRDLLSYLSDVLGSVKSLKAMARDNIADAILREHTHNLELATRREVMSREALFALQEPILAILIASGLYLALVQWQLSLSEVMVLVFLLARILGLLNKSQRRYQQLTAQESAYWSLRQAAEQARAAAEKTTGTLTPTLNQALTLDEVSFRYGQEVIFSGLSLQLPVNRLVAITGPSGAGKSTFLDLLCGLIEPESGRILVDGQDLHDIDKRQWRHLIGYVSQDTILLHDSIANNVLVGEPGLTEQDARVALELAGAWDFVTKLPQGMHTVVGERGGRLSGGQRQRIAIARALAHRPRFLILDEPTSALDPSSERTICNTLQHLAKNFTVVVVSHQPAVTEAADQVYLLRDGVLQAIDHGDYFDLKNR